MSECIFLNELCVLGFEMGGSGVKRWSSSDWVTLAKLSSSKDETIFCENRRLLTSLK
jgi:hypothetical protein